MNKIAIQLYGYLRTYEKTINSFFTKLVYVYESNGIDVDIFIHTWNYQDSDKLKNSDLNQIISAYNPKLIIIEEQKNKFKNKNIDVLINNKTRKVDDIYNLFHSIYSVNRLRNKYEKDNKFKYDWIIQTRFDLYFNTNFFIYDFLNVYYKNCLKFNKNSIFYAKTPYNRTNIDDELFLLNSDLIYFADSITMNKATSLLKNFDLVFKNKYISTEWFIFNHWTKNHLKPIGINFTFDKDFYILKNKN